MNHLACLFLVLGVVPCVWCVAQTDGPSRTPQFPLKDKRQLLTDEQIALARQNVTTYPAAKTIADQIVAQANAWLEWTDADVRQLIPSWKVPRAFDVGTEGCPKCGKAIHEKGGTYPWIIDVHAPFKIKCPVDGSVYPSNDFDKYYRSGFTDKRFLEGEYSDDGWGWVNAEGKRQWFVAHACHWLWMNHIIPGVLNLSRAYVLTGDPRYAHKTVVMLDRIAEVYPGMDHANQSRYGQLQRERGSHYGGKIVNRIWETGVLQNFAESYDSVWETIDGDAALPAATGRSGPEVRANIEANILEEGIDAYFKQEIQGNFGMHQRALVYTVASRQYGKVDEWLDGIFTYSGSTQLYTGLDYALYNLVYRDGLPYETSPGYNWIWVNAITSIAETLERAGRDVYGIPKTKRLYDGPLDLINARFTTPSVGDSGSVDGGIVGRDAETYQAAYRAFEDPRYLAHLAACDATGDHAFANYETLFHPPIEAATGTWPAQRPRLLDGYGMAILNNAADSVSASLYYGYHGGHGHFDRLHFDVYANGRPMMPDLGYPDFMNDYVSGIYTWSKNTISHNTVTVDAGRQRGNQTGTVHLFAAGPCVRAVDIDAPETYPQCSRYRRCLIMVDRPDGGAYFIDVFSVTGGHRHDYSLHGPVGVFAVSGGTWDAQPTGTLAGENVAPGEIFDDAAMGAKDYKDGYSGYLGSGFQHLIDVRRHNQGDWVAEWRHEKDNEAGLRIRILEQSEQQIILADARVSPIKYPQLVTYLIARRQGPEGLASRFVSVIEPFKTAPFIAAVTSRSLNQEDAVAIEVAFEDGGRDFLLYGSGVGEKVIEDAGIRTDARLAFVRTENGAVSQTYFADGTFLEAAGQRTTAQAIRGEVVSTVPRESEIRVRLDATSSGFDAHALEGKVAHFANAFRKTSHEIARAEFDNGELVLHTRDDLLVGRAHVTGIQPGSIATDTAFLFAPVYRGTMLADVAFSRFLRVREVRDASIVLAEPLPGDHPFKQDENVWLVNVGAGDRFEVPAAAAAP